MPDLLSRIRDEVRTFSDRSLQESAAGLLGVLGYKSNRVPALDGVPAFRDLCEEEELTATQLASFDDWSDVQAVFQFTEDELRASDALAGVAAFEKSRAESFLFMAVQLRDGEYARGRLADMTRNVNRVFAMPVIVIYRYRRPAGANVFTVAVVHRRAHKRDPTRDVLERVTLVKDVRAEDPHRAHIDILAGLTLEKLSREHERWSFDELHAAWEKALDTEPLNRRFYRQLFDWFERACREGEWPPDAPLEQQVIRCITRVLFVWFIKEKGLVSDDWFKRERMEELLRECGGSDYYRAVLQNLFFATLNAPSEQRAWSTRTRDSHRVFSRWRYRSLIRDIEGFQALMARTPFINGGLFDCLDDEESERSGGKRVDMFSDPDPADGPAAKRARRRAWKLLNVPDALFFDDAGLFTLLQRFKFTVKENTPVETEVALDPELLGKVFEHLLAAYNPETRDTARKQTGSYYTPRPVVDYMVDEALIIALAEKAQPEDGDADFWRARLRYLLDYEDAGDLFEPEDTEAVVRGIADLKVLDPAVGSGAFPMAVLNKLTLALRRLDPENKLWLKLQKEAATRRSTAAYETRDPVEREDDLIEISRTFQRYSDDFGRKLYLIQNSIYGADIQAIACQIAKLRFFISLAIEQEPDRQLPNQGIKPLPNLETRFVAADALLELQRERTLSSESERVRELEGELLANRERHFHANSRQAKLDCMAEDRRLRTHLAGELEALGFPTDTAEQVARWDPYDQNKVAPWFDAEYMFGVKRGFDVVIGNPPYIQLQRDGGRLRRRYGDAGYATYASTGDIYGLFFEKGCRLLRPRGALAYITSNSWLRAKYGEPLREYFDRRHTPLRLIDMGKDVFDAVVDASVLVLRAGGTAEPFPGVDIDRIQDPREFPPPAPEWAQVRPNRTEPWSILTDVEWSVMEKMLARGTPLGDWDDISIYRGILTGYNAAFLVDDECRQRLLADDPKSAELLAPILRGRDIQRYRAQWAGLWLVSTLPSLNVDIDEYPAVKRHLLSFGKERLGQTGRVLRNGQRARKKTPHDWFELQDTCAYHDEFAAPKLLWIELAERGRFAYDESGLYAEATAFMMTGTPAKYLCAILNSRLIQWFLQHFAPTSGMGALRWKKIYLERVPVIREDPQDLLIDLIDSIIRTKGTDTRADTSKIETAIDQHIYKMYDLNAAEIRAITS